VNIRSMGPLSRLGTVCLVCAAAVWPTGAQKPRMYPEVARNELAKTPHPCKDKYDDDRISAWVTRHLKGFPESKEPQMLLLLGGSGAGKGTFLKYWGDFEKNNKDQHWIKPGEFVQHGLDEYLQYIPEFLETVSDKKNVYMDAADACYKPAAIPAAKKANAEIIARKLNVIYEDTGKDLKRVQERIIPPFYNAGYRVTVVYIDNEPEQAIARAQRRFQETGRYASPDYVRSTFEGTFDNYEEIKTMKEVKEAVFCDNHRRTIFCWGDGERPKDALIPNHLLGKGRPEHRWDRPKADRYAEL